jgi:hypothetical protein
VQRSVSREKLDAPKADPKHHKVEFENDWVHTPDSQGARKIVAVRWP